jgi:hypothetical protein
MLPGFDASEQPLRYGVEILILYASRDIYVGFMFKFWKWLKLVNLQRPLPTRKGIFHILEDTALLTNCYKIPKFPLHIPLPFPIFLMTKGFLIKSKIIISITTSCVKISHVGLVPTIAAA